MLGLEMLLTQIATLKDEVNVNMNDTERQRDEAKIGLKYMHNKILAKVSNIVKHYHNSSTHSRCCHLESDTEQPVRCITRSVDIINYWQQFNFWQNRITLDTGCEIWVKQTQQTSESDEASIISYEEDGTLTYCKCTAEIILFENPKHYCLLIMHCASVPRRCV